MSFSVRALRKEFEIRNWSKIIEQNPYVAVVQMTGGKAWGRTNMKARILGSHLRSDKVHARVAVPKSAREGAKRTRYNELGELFRGSPSAVVYGNEADTVIETVKRATDLIDGGILIGGRFGDQVVTARTWKQVLESDGEIAEWRKLIDVFARPPGVLQLLDRQSKDTIHLLQQASGSQELLGVLNKMEEKVKDD